MPTRTRSTLAKLYKIDGHTIEDARFSIGSEVNDFVLTWATRLSLSLTRLDTVGGFVRYCVFSSLGGRAWLFDSFRDVRASYCLLSLREQAINRLSTKASIIIDDG
jgi:hypothetical protein